MKKESENGRDRMSVREGKSEKKGGEEREIRLRAQSLM